MKYNLGCGQLPMEGWENIDLKNGRNAYPLDIPDDSADVIRASHLLEHFDGKEVFNVLKNWASKLKNGGELMIAVPDFEKIANAYVNKEQNWNVSGYLMGGQTDATDYHKSIFDRNSLAEMLNSAGFTDVKEWKSDIKDCASLPVSLNLCGKKQANTVKRRIESVISMPRLSFTDTMDCMMTEIVARGLPIKKGTGVFWSQVLTRMIEESLAKNTDYILTLDYDTWFRFGHVEKLLSLMEMHPELDAICPVQMKRESDSPLMGLIGADGKRVSEIAHSELEKDILPILTGHFGLTVFRASAFEKLKKPWFIGQPGKDGSWHDDRVDDDIYFWNNFHESGCNAAIAPKVNIGHLQLVCTFPGHYKNDFKCIHVPLADVGQIKNVPEHCQW